MEYSGTSGWREDTEGVDERAGSGPTTAEAPPVEQCFARSSRPLSVPKTTPDRLRERGTRQLYPLSHEALQSSVASIGKIPLAEVLGSCPRDSLTIAGDAGEDLIGRLRPDKRLGVGVGHGDLLADGRLKSQRTAMGTADPLLGEQPEPALDHVQPGTARGGEVQMHARMPGSSDGSGASCGCSRCPESGAGPVSRGPRRPCPPDPGGKEQSDGAAWQSGETWRAEIPRGSATGIFRYESTALPTELRRPRSRRVPHPKPDFLASAGGSVGRA